MLTGRRDRGKKNGVNRGQEEPDNARRPSINNRPAENINEIAKRVSAGR
jgi:hypothetical protein